MRRLTIAIGCLVVLTVGLYAATGTPSTLRVVTDSNNNLLITSNMQVGATTTSIFGSTRLRTDSNNNLGVVLVGGVTPTYPQLIPPSTCAAPSLAEAGSPTTGIAFTLTPSIINCLNGVSTTTLTSTGLISVVPILAANGTASDPGLSFSGFTGQGLWATAGVLHFSANGVERLYLDDTNVWVKSNTSNILFGSAAALAITSTAPTFAGTGMVFAVGTGSTAFDWSVTITTANAQSSFTIILPSATNAWTCDGFSLTNPGSTKLTMSSRTATTAVMTQYSQTLGTASNFADANVIVGKCTAH